MWWENEDMMQLPELFSRIHKELPNHGFILRLLKGSEGKLLILTLYRVNSHTNIFDTKKSKK